jgi:hypothetical protein
VLKVYFLLLFTMFLIANYLINTTAASIFGVLEETKRLDQHPLDPTRVRLGHILLQPVITQDLLGHFDDDVVGF